MTLNSPPDGNNSENIELLDYASGSDHTYVNILHTCFGQQWGDLEYWRNKHARRAGFDPRDVKQFRVNEVSAACFHVSMVSLVLEPGLYVQASLGGDLAVLPEFRRKGLVEKAHQIFSKELYDRGVAVRCSFTSPELHSRVYSKKLAHVFVPTVTATYRKILSSSLLATKILVYVDSLKNHWVAQRILRDGPLTIALRIPQYDPCVFVLTQQCATLIPVFKGRVDVDITLPYRAVAGARTGLNSIVWMVAACLLNGEARARGIWELARRLL